MRGLLSIAVAGILLLPAIARAEWSSLDKSDPITDQKTAGRFAKLIPNESDNGSGQFALVCNPDKKIRLALDFGSTLNPTTTTDVVWIIYRVDQNKPNDSYWWMSHDRKAVTADLDQDMKGSLAHGTRLAFRFTNQKGTPLTAVFDISGIDKAMAEVEAQCAPGQ
jgi:hypothetical protein